MQVVQWNMDNSVAMTDQGKILFLCVHIDGPTYCLAQLIIWLLLLLTVINPVGSVNGLATFLLPNAEP